MTKQTLETMVKPETVARYAGELGMGRVCMAYGPMDAGKFRWLWECSFGDQPIPEGIMPQETAAALPGSASTPHEHKWRFSATGGWYCESCSVKGGNGTAPVEESPTVPVSDAEISDNAIRARHLLREELDRVKGELEAAKAQRDCLQDWKESAISVTPPLQEIAKEIGVELGASIHDKILPAIQKLKQERDESRAESDRLTDHMIGLTMIAGDAGAAARQALASGGMIHALRAKLEQAESSLAKAHAGAAGMREAIEGLADNLEHAADTYTERNSLRAELRGACEVLRQAVSYNCGADYVPRAKLAELRGLSPHFGKWELRVDEHGAIVVTLNERVERYSPEAFFQRLFSEEYLALRKAYTAYTKEAQ